MDIETDLDNEMSYVDRVAHAHGGDEHDSDGEDDEDWVEGESDIDEDDGDGEEEDDEEMEEGPEQGQDDGGDRMEEEPEQDHADGGGDDSAAGESDDVLEYDFDELWDDELLYFDLGEGPDRMIRNDTEITRARPVQMKLSEMGRECLTWRLENQKSFSDWTIVVSSDDGSIDPVMYNVHRNILATGPKKSGYFESMLSSGQFQEQSSSTSPIALPVGIASAFPLFLDYLYAPISEANYVITPENFMQLRYLADYFLVPTLSDSVHEFIKQDMNCLERTEEYLRMAVQEGLDELIAHAAHVCIRNVRGIEKDSTLLHAMPPAFFWHVIVYASQIGREQFEDEDASDFAVWINALVVSYVRKHGERLGLPYFLAVFDRIANVMPNDCQASAQVVVDYLHIFKIHGWTLEFKPNLTTDVFCERFVRRCAETIYRYTRERCLRECQVQEIMSLVPHCIAANLFVMASKELRGEADNNGRVVEVE